jgi:hypothetical protein
MTVEEAKKDLGDIDRFCRCVCDYCTANDWYCPTYCEMLEKARKIDFNRILKCYAKHEGDLMKVVRYIKATKIQRKKGGY